MGGRDATERGGFLRRKEAPLNSGSPALETRGERGMTSTVSATFQPISPASWHPNPGPPKPEATRANEQWAGEEGQAASLWGRRGPAPRIQGAPGSGSGVWRGACGGGRERLPRRAERERLSGLLSYVATALSRLSPFESRLNWGQIQFLLESSPCWCFRGASRPLQPPL